MSTYNALVVDDTPANCDFLVRLLTQAKFNVLGAATGQAALDAMYNDAIPLKIAIVDMELPDMSGLQLTMRLRERYPDVLIIVATMHDDYSWIRKSFEMGCNIFLVKPHGFMELFRRLTTFGLDELCYGDPLIIDQYGPRCFQMNKDASQSG